MSDIVYVSKSSIERKQGPLRIAQWSAQWQRLRDRTVD